RGPPPGPAGLDHRDGAGPAGRARRRPLARPRSQCKGHRPCAARARAALTDPLPDPDQVPLAVLEPGGALADTALARVAALDLGDAVDRPQPGHVVVLERDPSRAQLGHRGVDVVYLPAHLGVLARRAAAGQ